MLILRLLPIALLALVLFTGSAGSVAAQVAPSDSDGDGLSDEFEAGFGPGGIDIISAETDNTASATGSALLGSVITIGSFSVALPPGTKGPSAAPIFLKISGNSGLSFSAFEVQNAILLEGSTKGFEMPASDGTVVCIHDRTDASIESVTDGACPVWPDDLQCPSGKGSSSTPQDGRFEIVTTKTPEPVCEPTTYTITRISADRVRIEGLSHTAVAILDSAPSSVGGTAGLLAAGPDSSPQTAAGSALAVGVYAGALAAVAVAILALIAGGWHARRRWLR